MQQATFSVSYSTLTGRCFGCNRTSFTLYVFFTPQQKLRWNSTSYLLRCRNPNYKSITENWSNFSLTNDLLTISSILPKSPRGRIAELKQI